MATFVIDTNKIGDIRSDISYEILPKISSCYNTVVSVKSNLPSKVSNKKWINSNLYSLYKDIDNIYDDVVKINNLLYKAIEKMNEAEARMLKWNSLKTAAVDSGRKFVAKGKSFGEDIYEGYQDAKAWFDETSEEVSAWLDETGAAIDEIVDTYTDKFINCVSNTWDKFKENPFEATAATIVVAFESLLKGLLAIVLAIVDLAIIVGTVVVTPFTAIADGVNYLLTGESGGFTKYYWDGAMDMVADAGSLYNDCCNWLTDINPDWVEEYSLISVGGTVDQIIQGIGYMIGIIGISVATFGTATPVTLAATAGSLGFSKGTAKAWEEGKDAVEGLILGGINGIWEGVQYYIGGKIGTATFEKITGNISNAFLQKLSVSLMRIGLDSVTGAVEVPFQSIVAMADTRLDDIEGNELSLSEAWDATGGIQAMFVQTVIAGAGSTFGEVLDFGKAFKNAKNANKLTDLMNKINIDDFNQYKLKYDSSKFKLGLKIFGDHKYNKIIKLDNKLSDFFRNILSNGSKATFSDGLNDIYINDIANAAKNAENPFGRFSRSKETADVEVIEEVDNIVKNVDNSLEDNVVSNKISDSDISEANYYAKKGNFSRFTFEDASELPDLDSNFWKDIEHPELTYIAVDGKSMTFDEALVYKQSYHSYVKDINLKEIDNLTMDNLNYSKTGYAEAAAAKFASSAKRYVYTDTNDFIGLNKRISDNGLYHFTDATDAIMDSGYIKATAEGWNLKAIGDKIAGKSYGKPKTFFFEGIPEAGAFATNIDEIPLKTTAIKVEPTSDVLNSPNLRIRNLDDGAITWDGRFDLTDQKVSKQYFVLTVDEGELKYINVPESVYNSYDNTPAGKQLAEFISNKKNIQAIKDDYLVNTSLKGTNAKISDNSKIISLIDRSKTILKDKAGAINLEWFNKLKNSAYEYKLKKKYPWAYEDIKDWRSLGTITADVEKNLKEIFFDDDYVIGVHRTAMDGSANSIYNDGLKLTGDLSSGVVNKNIDLENNIEFIKNESDFNYEFFKRQVRTASMYKTFNKKGHAMIVKIPKSDIGNFDKILTHNGTNYVLKPDYVVGDVFVDDLNIISGKFKTNVNSDNINLKNVTVFENAKQILKNNEGKFSFARKKNTDIDISTIDVDDFAKKYDELTGKISSLQFKNDRSSKNQLKKLLIEKENSDKILVKLEEIFKNYVDPDHGFQCFDMTTSQHWRLGGLQHVINLNKKGYMSADVGRYFSSIFDDGEYEIRVHKGHSMNKDNIFCDGLFNNGKKMGAMNNGIPQLDDTTVKCENIFDFVEKAKHVGSFSEGGQPTDGLFVLKIPKGLSDADVMIRNSDGRYIIDPKYIMGYMESKNGVVGDVEFNWNSLDLKKLDSFFKGLDNNKYDYYGVDQHVLESGPQSEMFRIEDKLIDSGFHPHDAANITMNLDSTGACSYAATCNALITLFKNHDDLFQTHFGYSLYKNIDGKTQLNSAELLTDLYVFANSVENGGSLFENKKIISTINNGRLDTEKQLCMIKTLGGVQDSILTKFLESKGINKNFKTETIAYYLDRKISSQIEEVEAIRSVIAKKLSEGEAISMCVYKTKMGEMRFVSEDNSIIYSTNDFEVDNSGHAVFVTGLSDDGIIVSSWGERFTIPNRDFLDGFFRIDSSKIV